MKHLAALSKVPAHAANTQLVEKFTGLLEILDRVALAQRQAAWKAPFPIGGGETTTTTTTGAGTNTGGTLPF